jgi:hypothetical protein
MPSGLLYESSLDSDYELVSDIVCSSHFVSTAIRLTLGVEESCQGL